MGLVIFGSDGNNISGNVISGHGSIIRQQLGIGAYLFASSGNLICCNEFKDNFPYGLFVFNYLGSNITIVGRNNFISCLAGFAVHIHLAGFGVSPVPSLCSYIKDLLLVFANGFSDVWEEVQRVLSFVASLDFLIRVKQPPFIGGFVSGCSWVRNYWFNWDGRGPKEIYGIISIFLGHKIFIPLPWLDFDWNPAGEPYDIP